MKQLLLRRARASFRFATLWTALIAVCSVVLVMTTNAHAFPGQLVQDRLWGVSAPWVVFSVSAMQSVSVLRLTKLSTSSCDDPVQRTGLGMAPLCSGEPTTLAEGWVHVFSKQTGREAVPAIHFIEVGGTNILLRTPLTLAAGDYALMIHGGERTRGFIAMQAALFSANDMNEQSPLAANTVEMSDNIFFDLADSPEAYAVESVIVGDGPTEIDDQDTGFAVAGKGGNTLNDWMGVQSTEAWIFADGTMAAIGADLQMSGVGPAARLPQMRPRNGFVLIRPFARPPFALADFAVDDREYPSPPGRGRMRVVFNTATDSDFDRLGDLVENEVHTCNGTASTTSTESYEGVLCNDEIFFRFLNGGANGIGIRDPRDTDGDGISDGAEVLGADSTYGIPPNPMGGPGPGPVRRLTGVAQTFPAWGFDPLHKDMLVEIDRLGRANVQACAVDGRPNRRLGCPSGGAVFPVVNADDTGAIVGNPVEPIVVSMSQLQLWHRGFAQIPSGRANNPDRLPGIEAHFDVAISDAAGQFGPFGRLYNLWGRRTASQPFERFVRAGTVIRPWTPTQGPWRDANGSECSCLESTVAPDPRHGGFSRWALGYPDSRGQNGCNQRVNASIFGVAGTMMHEMGHTFGLNHGGPISVNNRDCVMPFGSPSRAGDFAREDKIIFPSMMNYAYVRTTRFGYFNTTTTAFPAFSTGRFAASPLPRFTTSPDVPLGFFGWPELDPFGSPGGIAALNFYSLKGSLGSPTYSIVNTNGQSGADFTRNGALDVGIVARGSVEPELSFQSGSGTTTVAINNLWCTNDEIPVTEGTCCQRGQQRQADGNCRQGAMTVAGVEPPIIRSMFAVGTYAAINIANRLYGFYVDDLVSEDDAVAARQLVPRRCTAADVAANRCQSWVEEGKVRWVAIDQVGTPLGGANPDAAGANAAHPCSEPGHACGHILPGRPSRGDIITFPNNTVNTRGSTVLSATTFNEGGERAAIAMTSRTGIVCGTRRTFRGTGYDTSYTGCPWGEAKLLIAAPGDLPNVGFRVLPLSVGLPGSISSVAVKAFDPNNNGAPTALVVVARDAASNGLYWSRCTAAGCAPFAALADGNGSQLQSVTGVALGVQPAAPGANPRLALLYGAVLQGFTNAALNLADISVSGVGLLRVLSSKPLTGAPPNPFLFVAGDSSVNLEFQRDGRGVLAAESISFRALSTTTSANPFVALDDAAATTVPTNVYEDRDYAVSRMVWRPGWNRTYDTVFRGRRLTFTDTFAPFVLSPGVSIALIRDERPADVSIRPDPRPDPRFTAELRHNFGGGVRGFGLEPPQGQLQLRFYPQMDGEALAPRFDYDETTTLAFNLCQQIAVTSGGYRGGDLNIPRSNAAVGAGTNARIWCPGAMGWSRDFVITNQTADLLERMEQGDSSTLSQGIAALVTAEGWYGAPQIDIREVPSSRPPATLECSANGGVGAMWYSDLAQEAQGP